MINLKIDCIQLSLRKLGILLAAFATSFLIIFSLLASQTALASSGFEASEGDVLITEFMAYPLSVDDSDGEWIELYNTTNVDIDLQGWKIKDAANTSHTISSNVVIESGSYVMLCRNSNIFNNGGVSCDYQWSSVALNNSNETINIFDNSSTPVLIHSVSYTSSQAGKSIVVGQDGTLSSENSIQYGLGDFGTPAKNVVSAQGMLYPSIQYAINSSDGGAMINIPEGEYAENLSITKPITLSGAGKDKTVIIGSHSITSSSVTLAGIMFYSNSASGLITIDSSSSSISNIEISECGFAVTHDGSVGIQITGNNSSNSISSITIDSSYFNTGYYNVSPTNEFMFIYGQAIIGGQPAPIGTVVDVVDPDGNIAGFFEVTTEGYYGALPVYQDDSETQEDEGATGDETLTIRINGKDAGQTFMYSGLGAMSEINISADSVPDDVSYDNVSTASEFMFIYGRVLIGGQPAPIGTVVDVVDPDGNVAGFFEVTTEGYYGALPVYQDDSETQEDEGATGDETLTIRINGKDSGQTFTYSGLGAMSEINISADSFSSAVIKIGAKNGSVMSSGLNSFTFSNNEIANLSSFISIEDGVLSDLSFAGNSYKNSPVVLKILQGSVGSGTLSGVVFLDNTVDPSCGYGIKVEIDPSEKIDAKSNWWGHQTGPKHSSNPEGSGVEISNYVLFDPWFENESKTVLSEGLPQSAILTSSVSGMTDLPSGENEIKLTEDAIIDFSSGVEESSLNGQITIGGSLIDLSSFTSATIAAPVNLTEEQTIGDKAIKIEKAVKVQSGNPGQNIKITNTESSVAVEVEIPDQTTILAPLGWNGAIRPPKTASASGSAPSGFQIGNTVIEVGDPGVTLLFDAPVKVFLPGVTGSVAYKPANSIVWHEITTLCDSATNPTNIAFPNECYAQSGSGTVIWTYHFTQFASISPVSSSSGSSSGGGGGTMYSYNPDNAKITINSAKKTTTSKIVTLSLYASRMEEVYAPLEMRISNDIDFIGSNWIKYSDMAEWNLSGGFGKKSVYVQFKNKYGTSAVASSDIEFLSEEQVVPKDEEDKNIENEFDIEKFANPTVLGSRDFADGVLVRDSTKRIYVVKNNSLQYVSSIKELVKDHAGKEITDVSDDVISTYRKVDSERKYSIGDLIRGSDMKIYEVRKPVKKHILTLSELREKHFGKKIYNVLDSVLKKY